MTAADLLPRKAGLALHPARTGAHKPCAPWDSQRAVRRAKESHGR